MRPGPYRGASRPLGPVRINVDSPQFRGLELCWLNGALVHGDTAPPPGSPRVSFEDPVPGAALGPHGTVGHSVTLARPRLVSEPTTIAVWMKWGAQIALIDLRDAGGTNYHQLFMRSSGTSLRATTTGQIAQAGSMTLNVPHHLAMVANGLSYRIGYVDAVAGSSNVATVADATLTLIQLGAGSASAIAEFRLYNAALSADDIRRMYLPETRWDLYEPA